jgi:hypothetical protein
MPRVHITIYGNVPDYIVVGSPEKINPAPAASCPSLPPPILVLQLNHYDSDMEGKLGQGFGKELNSTNAIIL